jgi:uncharacterized membrane protein YphA (DoxX/SURF4 family)
MNTNTQNSGNIVESVFKTLKYMYVIVPIVAGADKFLNLLVNWEQYLNPTMESLLPFSGATFMMIVGVIEIVAGILVFVNPKIGGYVVAAWLTSIALTLLIGFNYVDVAVRDLVMALTAFSMARLTKVVK